MVYKKIGGDATLFILCVGELATVLPSGIAQYKWLPFGIYCLEKNSNGRCSG